MARMKNRDSNRNRREDRIVQAQIRQEAYDKLSVSQKLDRLGSLRALKQRAKLVKILEAEVAQEEGRSLAGEVAEGFLALDPNAPVPAVLKEKKGAKAKRQAKKDKKAS
jgi:hypothetical protein